MENYTILFFFIPFLNNNSSLARKLYEGQAVLWQKVLAGEQGPCEMPERRLPVCEDRRQGTCCVGLPGSDGGDYCVLF